MKSQSSIPTISRDVIVIGLATIILIHKYFLILSSKKHDNSIALHCLYIPVPSVNKGFIIIIKLLFPGIIIIIISDHWICFLLLWYGAARTHGRSKQL